MKKNLIAPGVSNLLDKLIIANKIYIKAYSKVSNRLIKDQLKFLAERKAMFLETIAKEMHQYRSVEDLSLEDSISLEVDKALIELNHLLHEDNVRDILKFCIKREQELVNIYQQLIFQRSFYPFVEAIVVSQLEETRILLKELKEVNDAFFIGPRDI